MYPPGSGELETQTVKLASMKGHVTENMHIYIYISYIYIYIYVYTHIYPSGFWRARDTKSRPASRKGHVTEKNSSVPRSQPLFTQNRMRHVTYLDESCHTYESACHSKEEQTTSFPTLVYRSVDKSYNMYE